MRALRESQPPRPRASATRPEAGHGASIQTRIEPTFRIERFWKVADRLRGCKTLGSILVTRAESRGTYYPAAVAKGTIGLTLLLIMGGLARAQPSPTPSPEPSPEPISAAGESELRGTV